MSYPDAPEPVVPSNIARWVAELSGTFLLVFGLIGTASLSASFGQAFAVGWFGVAFALGLTVMIGAFAFGPISGGHFNPAVTLGLAAAGRFSWRDVIGYIIAQLIGAILAASVIFLFLTQGPGRTDQGGLFDTVVKSGFVSNGFDAHSPAGFSLFAAIIVEIIITGVFLYVILGVTHSRANNGFAPIAIGFTLTLMLFIAIPIDNASLNPARSIATAIYGGGDWLAQVWVFIVFPIVGALIAGFSYRPMFDGVRKYIGAPLTNAPVGTPTVVEEIVVEEIVVETPVADGPAVDDSK